MKGLLSLPLLLLLGCTSPPEIADQIIIGKIWTANDQQPWAEAIALRGERILAVGTEQEVMKTNGEKTQLTRYTPEQFIVPGFIDSHSHFGDGGFTLSSVQLRDAKTKEEFIRRIRQFAKTIPPGTWILGGNWDHENWGGELPDRDWIDAATPNNPVWISRLDGHMSLANSVTLKAAGVKDNVHAVEGGTIVRGKKGRVTGVLKDNAMDLVNSIQPAPSPEEEDRAILAAMHYVAAQGVTGVHSTSGFNAAFERLHAAHKLITRIYAGMPLTQWKELKSKIDKDGRGDEWLKRGILKAFADGSLGSHTAAFFKPFSDTPQDSGFFTSPHEQLYSLARSADSARLQVMVHAIGDRAIHSIVNLFERIEKENGPRDRRFRIEHLQHIQPSDIPRVASLHIIASMQPYHAIDDGRWAEKVIGAERCKSTYAFRSLLDANVTVAFGSDWPVAPATPLEGIYAAVTRRTLDDKNPGGWFPEQKITLQQALKAYTLDAAYSSFDEHTAGSLEKGKLADLVVLDQNLFDIAPERIRDVQVIQTLVGGKVVFSK